MGLVMADALLASGATVRLWGPFPEHMETLQRTRERPDRLAGFRLDDAVEVVTDVPAACEGVTALVNAIPTQYIRPVWERLRPSLPPDAPVICTSKGIENDSLLAPTEVIEAVVGDGRSMCALSGPTIAAELARHLPAAMVAAAPDASADLAQRLFSDAPWLRIYTSDDRRGVELAGACKNIIALAAGMIDGLDAGANAKSALLARGLAEIARLGEALGARTETFFGIAGIGDLATTCFSPYGRNRTCGERLGRGEAIDHVLETTVFVIEGVPTTRSVYGLARQHGIDMPITEAVHRILFEDLTPREAIRELMVRAPKPEVR